MNPRINYQKASQPAFRKFFELSQLMKESGLGTPATLAAKRATTTIPIVMESLSDVVGIGLVLTAVFIPVAFLGGLTGRLYQQFALTIAIAVVLSVFNALSLSPALSAMLLKPQHGPGRGPLGWFFRKFNLGFAREQIRDVVAGRGTRTEAAAMAALDRLASIHPLTVRLSAPFPFAQRATDVDGFVERVLGVLAVARIDGTWDRLKACPNDRCRWLFYDHSRNGSRTWCSMDVCGARSKMRAYRARRSDYFAQGVVAAFLAFLHLAARLQHTILFFTFGCQDNNGDIRELSDALGGGKTIQVGHHQI